jgi:hypothetical protein
MNTFGIEKYDKYLKDFLINAESHQIKVYDLKHKKEYILHQEPEEENVNMATTEEENFSNL